MKYDIHVHTKFSPCSSMSIDDILEKARLKGIDGICITDHNTRAAEDHLREGKQHNGIYVFFGIEYDSPDGDFLIFLPPGAALFDTNLGAVDVLQFVNEQGGVAVAAHPMREGRSVSEFIMRKGFCSVIETINGRNTSSENKKAREWLHKYRLRSCGGSDAHEPDEIGVVYTEFKDTIHTRQDLIQALKSGDYWPVTNNTFCTVSSICE